MHGNLQPTQRASSNVTGQSVAALATTDHLAVQSDSDEKWFAEICCQLIPKDSGLALRVLTGFEERTCYRYAAGDRKPPGYFIRALLHSEQGFQWLSAIMDGGNAEWWQELQRTRRISEAIASVE